MNTSIEFVRWSAPVQRGGYIVKTASPTAEFWAQWRSNKAALKREGVSVKPVAGGWVVEHWSRGQAGAVKDHTEARAAVPAPAPAQVVSGHKVAGVNWSEEQKAIFQFFALGKGNAIVQARAGTGKTTTIKEAFSYAPEQEMLYAVFNKKNQLEAEAKITDSRVEVKTLHGLGFSYIKVYWTNAAPDNDVENDRAEEAAIRLCREETGNTSLKPDIESEVITVITKIVGFAKNLFISPTWEQLVSLANEKDLSGPDTWTVERVAKCALYAIERSLEEDEQGRISFNDMVWLPVAKDWVHPMYDLVVVDEAQDMNLLQLTMAKGACNAGGRVVVVGDDRQAIYGFRGAASDGMEKMRVELDATVLGLTITYRCPKAVVNLASAIVPDYRAADSAPEGVVDFCEEHQIVSRVQAGDVILSRANAPLVAHCLALLRAGVPARIEGRDIAKTLSMQVNKLKAKSVPDFLRKLESWATKQLNRLKARTGTGPQQTQVEDTRDTLAALAEGCVNVSEITSRLNNLFEDSDKTNRPAVVLSSVHKAKGLEWDRVVLLKSTFNRKKKSEAEQKEESNIYYVAMTRAKKVLTFASENSKDWKGLAGVDANDPANN